jgi:hypothetical protein
VSLTANFAGTADWYPHRRTARPDDTSHPAGVIRRPLSALVRDLGGILGLGALALLLTAGAAPVLAIPIEIFGISPMAVTARWAVLPLAVAATLLMIRQTTPGKLAWRGFVAGLIAVAAYDSVRLSLVTLGWWGDFIPRLGQWVLGTDSPNVLVGYTWRYIGDGGGIGMAFFIACGVLATVRPAAVRRRPVALGVAYGVFVWSGLIATVALSAHGSSMLFALTPKTLAFSLVGHLIYGAVLGACLRRLPTVSLREDSPRLAPRRQREREWVFASSTA